MESCDVYAWNVNCHEMHRNMCLANYALYIWILLCLYLIAMTNELITTKKIPNYFKVLYNCYANNNPPPPPYTAHLCKRFVCGWYMFDHSFLTISLVIPQRQILIVLTSPINLELIDMYHYSLKETQYIIWVVLLWSHNQMTHCHIHYKWRIDVQCCGGVLTKLD